MGIKTRHINFEGSSDLDEQIQANGDVGFEALTGTASGKQYLRKNALTGEVKMHFYYTAMNTTYTSHGTAFGTINEGYRPNENVYVLARGYNGTAYEDVLIVITTAGKIYQSQSASKTYTVIVFDTFWYTDFSDYKFV